MIGQDVNENKIPTPFRGGVPGEDFFIRFKKKHKLSLKKPQGVEAHQKKSTDPEVITSGKVSERMKETVTKNVKDRNRQEKRKQPRQKKKTN
jgi:hypothetical protein